MGGVGMRSYEPAEFVSLLASDQLDEPMNLTVYGPVKADENDSSALLLSTSPLCEQWLRIPISSIASIQHGGTVSCKDHRHPFVRIVLAEPSEEEATAFLFMRLFALANANAAAARTRTSGPGPAPADAGDCETLTFDDVPYACCPPASGSGPWDCSILL
jgi:hypothetical protein